MKAKKILSIGLAILLTSGMTIGCTKQVTDKTDKDKGEFYETPKVNNADEALELLKLGNKRFVDDKVKHFNLGFDRREFLANGQNPHTVVVACSDSRVTPEYIFDQGLGDLFVIRVAGNVISEEEIGSIEYAVDHLDVSLVVLMGHEKCGAVTAAVDASMNEEIESTENIDSILDRIQPAVEKAKESDGNLKGDELVEKSVDENIELTLSDLVENSELVVNRIKDGKLKIMGAKYQLDTGKVEFGEFYSVD